jgi:chaperonin cofactor prefoldin
MNLAELQAARAQKIYEYGEISYELRLLEYRMDALSKQFTSVADTLDELEQKIDNLTATEKNNVKSLENS